MSQRNPMHREDCSPSTAFTTINAAEAIPGIVTPLTWSFFGDATDRACKQAFVDIGVMTQDMVGRQARAEDRMWDIFYGRAAGNVDMFRWVGDRMPGTSANAIEEQIFGNVRPGLEDNSTLQRLPFIVVKLPRAFAGVVGQLKQVTASVTPWWQQSVAPGGLPDAAAARVALSTAAKRFEEVMRPHTIATMLCQGMYDQQRKLAELAGRPGLELSLVTGCGDMAETDMLSDLWDVSRDALTLDEFVRRHGFHGPDEGELASRVWRVRRDPLVSLAQAYAKLPDERAPRQVEIARRAERERAERELSAALPKSRVPVARVVVRVAGKMIPLRETGKAAFLQCVDVGRAAADVIGEAMAAQGQLRQPADAFMLTVDELLRPPGDSADLAAERRERFEEYLGLDIPSFFYGVPEAFPVNDTAGSEDAGDVVTGLAVSSGIVKAPARVIRRPDEDIEAGDVLVCRTTDPGWASAMMLASALVIDIGGPISHGAIIARELGVPCVIGTGDACARIRTGDLLEVDGGKGQVTIVERAAAQQGALAETEPASAPRRSELPEAALPVLMTLRLKGRATIEDLVAAVELPEATVEELIAAAIDEEAVKDVRGAYRLLPPGRERLTELLESERAHADPGVVSAAYDEFCSVNGAFKDLANDWQLAGEDHRQDLIDELESVHERVTDVISRLAKQVPRIARYGDRLAAALDRVRNDEPEWLLKPLVDSYHTVWFELHEDLITLAGLTREEEAAAGRAN